jgi:hypothetical protein
MEDRLNNSALLNQVEVEEELPLKVVPDWREQVEKGEHLARMLDRHLDYEARGRLLRNPYDFRPQHLCPEQRVQAITDMFSGTR